MSQDNAFLETIRANPDDDTPRMVYADWLEEQGETDRAEFVRLECQLARLPEAATEFAPLHQRLWVLRRKLDSAWVARLGVRTFLIMPIPPQSRSIRTPLEATGQVALPAGPHGYFARLDFRLEPFVGSAVVVEDRCEKLWPEPSFWAGTITGLRDFFVVQQEHDIHWRGLRIIILSFTYHAVDSSRRSFRQAAYVALRDTLGQ
jgi:uncharacterized protein (TIGR02996 family)